MGDKVLVVKAPFLLPLLAGLGSVAAGAITGILGRKAGKEGAEAIVGAGAKAAAGAATQGAKQMSGKQFAMQMAQQQQNAAAQQRQDQKAQQEQRALEMAEKAKGGAGTMQKQLQGVLDDLRLLKGTLQLPTALSEELRDTIKTLDNDHVIVDNKDETLVHNTTPFTEDIIRRLSETEDEKTEKPLFQPQQLFY
tara:strand:+ start:450 stop:1031 length:582 start_codon:yes stop_codon:yes gene_type:complete